MITLIKAVNYPYIMLQNPSLVVMYLAGPMICQINGVLTFLFIILIVFFS